MMLRSRLGFAIGLVGGLAGCGGSSEMATGTLAVTELPISPLDASLPLFDALQNGPSTRFPGNPTLSGNQVDIEITSTFDISLIDENGVLQTFNPSGRDNPYNETLTTYYENEGTDAFAWQIPFGSPGLPSEVAGLDYTTFGVWVLGAFQDTRGEVITPVEVADAGIVLLGALTPPGALPPSGFATYSGEVVAFDADCLFVNDLLDGTVTLNADFGAGIVQASLNLIAEADTPWGQIESDNMVLNATNQFSGNATSSNGHSGTMSGFFTGPSGEEVGGSFDLIREDENRVIGAFGGVDDFLRSGALLE